MRRALAKLGLVAAVMLLGAAVLASTASAKAPKPPEIKSVKFKGTPAEPLVVVKGRRVRLAAGRSGRRGPQLLRRRTGRARQRLRRRSSRLRRGQRRLGCRRRSRRLHRPDLQNVHRNRSDLHVRVQLLPGTVRAAEKGRRIHGHAPRAHQLRRHQDQRTEEEIGAARRPGGPAARRGSRGRLCRLGRAAADRTSAPDRTAARSRGRRWGRRPPVIAANAGATARSARTDRDLGLDSCVLGRLRCSPRGGDLRISDMEPRGRGRG